ncbi:MAG: ABC transporter ATP-binding protein [Pseudomonadota bacterium]
MSERIAVRNLTKKFGPIVAVDGVSFTLARGEVLGFLGPNGAGKSTAMKMIAGFLAPSAGTAVVCGHDVIEDPVGVKRSLGYLPEGAPLYADMTPAAFLNFIAGIRGFRGPEKRRRVAAAVARLQLEEVFYRPIDTLSKGFKRRVGLAQALLHDPEVLVLDEPTDGLDPNQKHQVRTLIRAMAHDKAIIVSTHILEEVEAVCTRAMIIARGRVVADGSPEALEARSRYHNAVSVVLKAEKAKAASADVRRLPDVAAVEEIAGEDDMACLIAFPRAGKTIVADINRLARDGALGIEEIRVERGRLDEVFRTITLEAN